MITFSELILMIFNHYLLGIRMHEPMQQYCPLFLESLIVAFGGRATIILHFVTILYAFFNEMASIFTDKMKKVSKRAKF